jgi:uncharacterized protein GlcG (DUF336 family)
LAYIEKDICVINRVGNDRIWLAANLVFEEAVRDERQMALAVTDEAGGLVFGARMEQADTRILTHSIRKAYTAAVMRRDTITFRDEDREREKTLADWGDSMLTHLVGGVVLRRDGEWHGAVGVGGNGTLRDDDIARMAAQVLLGG